MIFHVMNSGNFKDKCLIVLNCSNQRDSEKKKGLHNGWRR